MVQVEENLQEHEELIVRLHYWKLLLKGDVFIVILHVALALIVSEMLKIKIKKIVLEKVAPSHYVTFAMVSFVSKH